MGNACVLGLYSAIFLIYFLALVEQRKIHTMEKGENVVLQAIDKFRLFYFTGWTFILQILFLVTAILDETSKLLNVSVLVQKRLGRSRAFLFNTLVFPCSLLVVSIFWSIWNIDRELIFPRAIDTIFPLWLNHVMHTFILVPLMIELALPKKYNFVKFENAAVILVLYAMVYQMLYLSVYLRYGVWLYGVYTLLTWTQRLLFSILQLVLLLAYQRIGIAIQDRKRTNQARKIA